ncbi:chromosomal replication initiator protein DnaA [Candidatus Parcubacteria bacterium]|nr:chromosomal replication initiator protein DnaA [Candidatus Parcubacteria bacterium]
MNNEELWQAVLAQIQFNISQASFATWFKNTKILNKKEGLVIVSVPNNFSKEWLENKYNKIILKTLHNLDEGIKEAQYTVNHTEFKKQPTVSLPETDQLEFQELKINRETNLNPRYTFENFVVGPFNELPHAAAWAVSKNPGAVYNPLFIYGGVGLGKTHLIQAIGDKVKKNFPRKKIKYIPSEKFISGVVNSIRDHSIESFKTQYRKYDVLIIDDIQFLAGKEKTQEEFFHIFNTLYEENKQIILSADRPPKAISALEDRLRSRFEGGMIADVDFPDFETRMAILKVKSQEKRVNISDEILEYIATNIKKNIRELEGALNRLAAYQKINNKDADLLIIKNLLKTAILSPVKVINPRKIIQIVAEFYDLKEKDLIAASRKKEIVRPRQIAMYLLRNELSNSFPAIGRKFGGKDHTTAIHACTKIAKEKEENEILVEEIKLIKEQLYL